MMNSKEIAHARRIAQHEDGYRYIRESRSYRSDADGKLYAVSRYALYERQDDRARRVGTCDSYDDALSFLKGSNITQGDTDAS